MLFSKYGLGGKYFMEYILYSAYGLATLVKVRLGQLG
jgi:hypothetical protein